MGAPETAGWGSRDEARRAGMFLGRYKRAKRGRKGYESEGWATSSVTWLVRALRNVSRLCRQYLTVYVVLRGLYGVFSSLRGVSRLSAGRVGAGGRCSMGYVESSESRSHHQDGGGVEPPQRNLGGNTRKGVRRWEKQTRECDYVYEQQRNKSKSSSSSDGLLSQHSHTVTASTYIAVFPAFSSQIFAASMLI